MSAAKDSLISTEVLVETPESIDLNAEPAGIISRALACMLDWLIRGILLFVAYLLFVLIFGSTAGQGFTMITFFILWWFYPVIFEVYFNGQTIGKMQMGIAVVNDDLTPISWGTSMIRNVLRTADFMPLFYTFGLIAMATTPNFRRIGDIAAGTIVIYKQKNNLTRATSSKFPNSLPNSRPRPPTISLDRQDQIAIVGFTQRFRDLSEARQHELASILEPILPVDDKHRVDYLRGIGRWLLGDR